MADTASVHNQELQCITGFVGAVAGTRVQLIPEIGLLYTAAIHNQGIGVATDTLRYLFVHTVNLKCQFDGDRVAHIQIVQLGLH